MDELLRMEDLLASRAIDQMPVELMENLLVEELVASREALAPFLKAAPARAKWMLLRQMLSSAMCLQAHARTACVGRNIGAVIRHRASLKLAAAGAMAAEAYLQSSAARNGEPASDVVQQNPASDPASKANAGIPNAAQPANVAISVSDLHQKQTISGPPAASSTLRVAGGSRSPGLSGAAVFRRHAVASSQSPRKLPAANSAYDMPSGNRHRSRFAVESSPLGRAAPAVSVRQQQASPTAVMMQRARAARSNMPVYSPPPLSPPTAESNILMTTAAASFVSSDVALAESPNLAHNSQQPSPSVIWVGAAGVSSPSAVAAPSPKTLMVDPAPAVAMSEMPEPSGIASSWLQLRGQLEASIRAHEDSPFQDDAELTQHAEAVHSALEKEVALMQGWLRAKETAGVQPHHLLPAREFLRAKAAELQQLEALNQQLNIQRLREDQQLQQHALEVPPLSVTRRSLPQQPHIAALRVSSLERTPPSLQSAAASSVEVFSPPSGGNFSGQVVEGWSSLRVSSPLTPVSVSPNTILPSASSPSTPKKHDLGSEFEVSSAWGGTGLQQSSLVTDGSAIKSGSLLKSSEMSRERSFVVEDINDGGLQFRLHFQVKGLLHRKKLKIIKMMGGDCCDVFVFPVRRDGQPESVPTKVFSLQNSTAYVYPKEKMCVLLELGAASGLVTLSNCDVLMHFDNERDMEIFLLERCRVLKGQNLLPPPDGIFMVWILFTRPNSSSGGKNGRYALQIDRQSIIIRRSDKRASKQTIEMKVADCQFEKLPAGIKCYSFLGEFIIHSADDLQKITESVLQVKS